MALSGLPTAATWSILLGGESRAVITPGLGSTYTPVLPFDAHSDTHAPMIGTELCRANSRQLESGGELDLAPT